MGSGGSGIGFGDASDPLTMNVRHPLRCIELPSLPGRRRMARDAFEPDERMRNPPSMHLPWCRTVSPDAPSTTAGFLSNLSRIPALETIVPPSIADTAMVRSIRTGPGWIPLRIPPLARILQRYARSPPWTIPVPNPPASGVYTFQQWKARRIRFADTAIVRLYSGRCPEE